MCIKNPDRFATQVMLNAPIAIRGLTNKPDQDKLAKWIGRCESILCLIQLKLITDGYDLPVRELIARFNELWTKNYQH